jgi:hypothetical protein
VVSFLKRETKDDFNFDLDEAIEKIKYDDKFLTYMVANMAAIVEHSDEAIIGIDCDGTKCRLITTIFF